jgi:hypothetical protein
MKSTKPDKRPTVNRTERRRKGWFDFEWVGVEVHFDDRGITSHSLVTRYNDDGSTKSVTREEA